MLKRRLADMPTHNTVSHLYQGGFQENELKMGLDHESNADGNYTLFCSYLGSKCLGATRNLSVFIGS